MSFDGAFVAGVDALSIESAKPAVIDLYLVLNSAQITTLPNGDPLVFSSPGSVIVYDPNGALYPLAVEVNLSDDNPARWIGIHAGKPFSVWPFQFQKFGVRLTQLTANLGSSSKQYCGRLIVARSLDMNLAGSGPEVPSFARQSPCFTTMGELTTNTAYGGGTGPISYYTSISGAGAGVWRADIGIENIGTDIVFANLTVPGTAANLRRILPGKTFNVTLGLLPSNPISPTRVASNCNTTLQIFCENATGEIAWHRTAWY